MKIDTNACIGCGNCVDVCTANHLEVVNGVVQETATHCMACAHCMAMCLQKAIALDGTSYDNLAEYSAEAMTVAPDNLMNLLQYKRSMRKYLPQPIEREKIEEILKAVQYSSTSGNGRKMRCIVLDKKKDMYALAGMKALLDARKANEPSVGLLSEEVLQRRYDSMLQGADPMFFHAPIVILVVDEFSATQTGANAYIAASRMELVAESLGLGSCYIGFFTRAVAVNAELQRQLGIGEGEKLYAALTIGYPGFKYQRTVPRPELNVDWQ